MGSIDLRNVKWYDTVENNMGVQCVDTVGLWLCRKIRMKYSRKKNFYT
jgi:hypothetical protein